MNIVQMAAHRMAFDSQALKVASQNMAFLNVPKYQAVRLAPLRFDDSLQPQDMRRTDPKHLSFKGETWGGFAVKTAATGEKTSSSLKCKCLNWFSKNKERNRKC